MATELIFSQVFPLSISIIMLMIEILLHKLETKIWECKKGKVMMDNNRKLYCVSNLHLIIANNEMIWFTPTLETTIR